MALRRRYPQIYSSSVKLQLDVSSITLGAADFSKALQTIVPSSHRALAPSGRALDPALRPLLDHSLSLVLKSLLRVFPHAATQQTDGDNANGKDVSLGGRRRAWEPVVTAAATTTTTLVLSAVCLLVISSLPVLSLHLMGG